MKSFNEFSRTKSIEEQQLCDMNAQLNAMDRSLPEFKALVKRIEALQYKLHRAGITPAPIMTQAPVSHTVTNTNKGVSMKAPTFSNDLVVRKLQYQQFLVESGDHTMDEVVAMSMRELREAIDVLLPLTIAVHTQHALMVVRLHTI
jgi:hypothetical protein